MSLYWNFKNPFVLSAYKICFIKSEFLVLTCLPFSFRPPLFAVSGTVGNCLVSVPSPLTGHPCALPHLQSLPHLSNHSSDVTFPESPWPSLYLLQNFAITQTQFLACMSAGVSKQKGKLELFGILIKKWDSQGPSPSHFGSANRLWWGICIFNTCSGRFWFRCFSCHALKKLHIIVSIYLYLCSLWPPPTHPLSGQELSGTRPTYFHSCGPGVWPKYWDTLWWQNPFSHLV